MPLLQVHVSAVLLLRGGCVLHIGIYITLQTDDDRQTDE